MIDAINKAFGTSFQMEKIDKMKGLPVFMISRRSFYKVSDDTSCFLLVKLSNDEKFGVVALDKQRNQYEEKTNLLTVFWFENITRAQRDSLMDHHIPFVAAGNQLYIPFLGISIHNNFIKKKQTKISKMMPITQRLFLYLLYDCKGKRIIKKQAADYLEVTRTSITRASEQLETMGLICQEMLGKEYYMWTEYSGYELFEKAKKYLINPIQESFITKNMTALSDMPLAGESALAKYSLINPPNMNSIAIDKSLSDQYELKPVDERWEENKDLIRLELWKYNPALFVKNGVVDPISLYMTLSDIVDERIEGALEEMLEGYKW